MDVLCKYSRLRFMIIDAALRLGFKRIGIGKDFIHLDIDRGKATQVIWTY